MHKDLNRILCAALINEGFRERLLQDPATTIAVGYEGFSFSLTQDEQRLVNGIRTYSLEDFAAQVAGWLNPRTLNYQVMEEKSFLIPIELPQASTQLLDVTR